MTPLVSAIVLNTRAGRKTASCVESLLRQTVGDRLEVIVVDNHSQDESILTLHNRLGRFPNVRIIEARENLGFGKGYALGIAHASGEYILINNSEKILQQDGIEKLIAVLERDPSIGIVAPKLVHDDGTVRSSARSFPRPLDVIAKRTFLSKMFPKSVERYLQLNRSSNVERDVDWVVGGCIMMKKQLWNELGGFDPRFFLFFEDIDLCRRVWNSDKRVVYCPSVIAMDRKRRLSDMNALLMPFSMIGRAHISSAVRYFWKWRNSLPSGGVARHGG